MTETPPTPAVTPTMGDITSAIALYGTDQYLQGYNARRSEFDTLAAENLNLRDALRPFLKIPFGVNIHSTFRRSVYQYDAEVAHLTIESGASFVRDRISGQPNHPQRLLWRTLRDNGIKVLAQVGAIDIPEDRNALKAALIDLADCLQGVESYNEPEKAKDWIAKCASHTQWLWETVKGTPELAHLPILSPPLRDRNKNLQRDWSELLTALDGHYDVVNIHLYPTDDAGLDVAYLESRTKMLPAIAKGKPIAVTELGWNTGGAGVGGGYKVTEDQQQQHIAAGLKTLHTYGITGYVYELLDDPTPVTDYQSHWGLVACSGMKPDTWRSKGAVKATAQLGAGEWSQ